MLALQIVIVKEGEGRSVVLMCRRSVLFGARLMARISLLLWSSFGTSELFGRKERS